MIPRFFPRTSRRTSSSDRDKNQNYHYILIVFFSVIFINLENFNSILNSIHPRKCRKTNIVSFVFGILMLFERLSVAAFFDGYTAHRFEIGNAVYVLLSFAFVVLQTHISKNIAACHSGDVVKFRVNKKSRPKVTRFFLACNSNFG